MGMGQVMKLDRLLLLMLLSQATKATRWDEDWCLERYEVVGVSKYHLSVHIVKRGVISRLPGSSIVSGECVHLYLHGGHSMSVSGVRNEVTSSVDPSSAID